MSKPPGRPLRRDPWAGAAAKSTDAPKLRPAAVNRDDQATRVDPLTTTTPTSVACPHRRPAFPPGQTTPLPARRDETPRDHLAEATKLGVVVVTTQGSVAADRPCKASTAPPASASASASVSASISASISASSSASTSASTSPPSRPSRPSSPPRSPAVTGLPRGGRLGRAGGASRPVGLALARAVTRAAGDWGARGELPTRRRRGPPAVRAR